MDGEVGEECLDFGRAHVFGVAFVMEEDVAFNPVFVGLLGAVGVVFGANGVGDLVEEFAGRFWLQTLSHKRWVANLWAKHLTWNQPRAPKWVTTLD